MIAINSLRIKELLRNEGKEIDYLDDKFVMRTHDTDARLAALKYNNIAKDKYLDSFVYEIARELNVSIDYIYGWSDIKGKFIPQKSKVDDAINKQKEIIRLVNKYCRDQNIERKNTNILANETDIDREVFEYMFSGNTDWAYALTTSYHIISKLAKRFDFNFYTVLIFLLDTEEDIQQEQLAKELSLRYEKEYNIVTV